MSIRAKAFTAQQARAARAVMGLSVQKLARLSGVSESSIRRIEGHGNGITLDLVVRLQEFFERKDFQFTVDAGDFVVKWSSRK